MTRPNFYTILCLDPKVDDLTEIKDAIRQKQAEWSRQRNHPTKARTAQRNLELLDEICRVMLNSEQRENEAREYSENRNEVVRQATRDLDDHIFVMAVKGFVTEEELDALYTRFGSQFSGSQIRQRVHVPTRKFVPNTEVDGGEIDKVTLRQVEDRLQIVGKQNLYEFLDCANDTSLSILQQKVREGFRRITSVNRSDADVTASKELLGHCKVMFRSEQKRAQYDMALTLKSLTLIDPLLHAAASNGVLRSDVLNAIVVCAEDKGVPVRVARDYILQLAAANNYDVEKHIVTNQALQRCRMCGALNHGNAKACRKCQQSLRVSCPKCHTENTPSSRICAFCGFPIGDVAELRRIIRAIEAALDIGKVAEAKQLLTEANPFFADLKESDMPLASTVGIAQQKQGGVPSASKKIKALPKPNIFISYRGDDSSHATARISGQLISSFGSENVFMGTQSIPLGFDYRSLLNVAVSHCDIALVVIGNQWLGEPDERGTRRIDMDDDQVRIEIEAALRRDIPVVPILVDNAQLPAAQQLPAQLRELSFRQGIVLHNDPHFESDVSSIVRRLMQWWNSVHHARQIRQEAECEGAQHQECHSHFDVFMSYNSQDRLLVKQVADALKARGMSVWFDEWELIPGHTWQNILESVIRTCNSAVVCVGDNGIGPWEEPEMQALLRRFVKEKEAGNAISVIPLLLPGAPQTVALPMFLEAFTWVDLRKGLEQEALDRLQWGITGMKPI